MSLKVYCPKTTFEKHMFSFLFFFLSFWFCLFVCLFMFVFVFCDFALFVFLSLKLFFLYVCLLVFFLLLVVCLSIKTKNTKQQKRKTTNSTKIWVEPKCSGRVINTYLLYDTQHVIHIFKTCLTPLYAGRHE